MLVSNTSAHTGVQAGDDLSKPETAGWFFDPLSAHSYDLIVVDPPWPFKTWSQAGQRKSASMHYRVMTLADIMALPVRQLLKDNAVILLWATGAMLDQAVAVMQAWGVTFKTEIAWRKVTRNGKVRMGCGFWARTMHEPILLGTLGKPGKFTLPSCFDGIAREHSRKPDEFYRMITERTPDLRRADLFARERREGWDAWGDEVGKFSSPRIGAERDTTLIRGSEPLGVLS
ncbi:MULTISPECIES: MT-A70 family methyltransferase [Bradyrhizobium]|uniref:MT-A70 family methyltransferase n=1 Tax=Bradyrhizobium elkanii TaxID=29448 RepID=UPI000401F09D|nr:MT-A70 family methyltransferase [Bradyrhizobium elkanii]